MERETGKAARKKVLVFGNPLVEADSIALRILKRLRQGFPQIEFIEADSIEELPDHGKDLVILDAVKGAKDVTLIEDLDRIELGRIFSTHDFDLGYNLRLLKKIGRIDSVRIIGLPQYIGEKEAVEKVSGIIKSI